MKLGIRSGKRSLAACKTSPPNELVRYPEASSRSLISNHGADWRNPPGYKQTGPQPRPFFRIAYNRRTVHSDVLQFSMRCAILRYIATRAWSQTNISARLARRRPRRQEAGTAQRKWCRWRSPLRDRQCHRRSSTEPGHRRFSPAARWSIAGRRRANTVGRA